MKALLVSYKKDSIDSISMVDVPNCYSGDLEELDFCVGSNQQVIEKNSPSWDYYAQLFYKMNEGIYCSDNTESYRCCPACDNNGFLPNFERCDTCEKYDSDEEAQKAATIWLLDLVASGNTEQYILEEYATALRDTIR